MSKYVKQSTAGTTSIATTSTTDEYIIAAKTGKVTSIVFNQLSGLAAHDTNYLTFSVTNLGAAGAGTAALLAATDANTTKATGGTVKNIEIKTSGLLNARTNSLNEQQYNHIVAVVHGAPTGKKGVVSPFATPTPRFSTGIVSEQRSTFAASLTFGGPFVLQRGQVFDMVFSEQLTP